MIASSEIVSGGQGRFPLWSDVIQQRFLTGQLRTLPSEWLGWSVWSGFAFYWTIAAVLIGALVALTRARASYHGNLMIAR